MPTEPHPPKAISVNAEGEPDGFLPAPGWWSERGPQGVTRLVVSAPPDTLAAAHHRLLGVLRSPLGFLFRQVVDRRNPRPQEAPPRDLVALEVPAELLLDALARASRLVYHDARAEFWVRGADGDQVILDGDGLIYAYPDDPAFRDALALTGLPEGKVATLQERDYVKHWFHADGDAQEDALVTELGLIEVTPQRKSG